MILVKVPGVNGLGMTKGTERFGDYFCETFKDDLKKWQIEEIKVDNSRVDEQLEKIHKGVKNLLKEDNLFIVGGDHSISYPCGNAFFEDCNQQGRDCCLVVLDAHLDLMPPLKEPTHEEWLRALIEEGFPSERVLVIGSRANEPEEDSYAKEKRIRMISVDEVRGKWDKVEKEIEKFISGREIYFSFDVDVLDSAVVGATGYPTSGGLGIKETKDIFDLVLKGEVRVLDFVEVNPGKGGLEETMYVVERVFEDFFKNRKV